MKRIRTGLLLLLITLLSACASAVPQAATPAPVRLTFLIAGDPADEAAYRTLIDGFEAANADIRVDLLNIPSAADFRRRLTADFAAGAPPDVFLINYRRYGPFVAKGAIAMAAPYLAASDRIQASDFYPQALAAFTWQGELACLPQNLSSPVIYYNKDLFAAAGVAEPGPAWDWDAFVATAQALTGDQDGDGVIDIYGLGSEPSLVRMAPFVWMNGGDVVDDPGAPTRLTLDAPPARAALAWFIDLQRTHHVVPDAVAEEAESSLSRFLNGRLAMFIDSRRAVPEFRTIQGFDWDVAPLPEGEQRASVLHADAYCMAAAGRHKAAAWRFVEYANTLAGQTILARTGRTVPSRIELATSPIFLDPQAKPAHSQVFIDAIAGIRSLPSMATWSDIEGVVDKELEQAFYGQITLEEAIRNAETRSAEFFRPP